MLIKKKHVSHGVGFVTECLGMRIIKFKEYTCFFISMDFISMAKTHCVLVGLGMAKIEFDKKIAWRTKHG